MHPTVSRQEGDIEATPDKIFANFLDNKNNYLNLQH